MKPTPHTMSALGGSLLILLQGCAMFVRSSPSGSSQMQPENAATLQTTVVEQPAAQAPVEGSTAAIVEAPAAPPSESPPVATQAPAAVAVVPSAPAATATAPAVQKAPV